MKTHSGKSNPFLTWIISASILFCVLYLCSMAGATEEYAERTGKGCIFCHHESTGGQLKTAGFAYIRNGYQYPIPQRILKKSAAFQTKTLKTIRFIIGYIHLLAAVIFFGAIFYIHIFIGPRQLKGGIPKHERILGVTCMATLGLTGAYLTWVRIDRFEQFFSNTFGLMLFIKIVLFLLMALIAVFAITTIHRRMQKEARAVSASSSKDEVSLSNLGHYDGTEGKKAYVVVGRKLYDVTESDKWKEGRHFGKHSAGSDLTEALESAPHGKEVLENVRFMSEISEGEKSSEKPAFAQKIFVRMAYTNLVIIFLILACISVWRWDFPVRIIPEKRAEVIAGTGCIRCHGKDNPGIIHEWENSVHAKVGVDCYKCHKTDKSNSLFNSAHLKNDPHPIAIVVTPKVCSGCHPKEVAQYNKSKHANTHEIMWKVDYWLNDGMNNAIERTTGCFACHGTVIEVKDGRPSAGTWPNVGVGRKNPDGSLGSCSSCHTRHRFSVAEARKPEACDQCHLGPDHPQIEIYNESKHGTIYHAEGSDWKWSTDDGIWKAGRDFRAPTCSVCHMSQAGKLTKTHDVTERLSWETQAPLTVRPEEFKPFPAKTNWKEERKKMMAVCLQCHSKSWVFDHFSNFDKTILNYNDLYYIPIKKEMDELYELGILSRDLYFDEKLEWEFYELWHHEGRRARMGVAMMAPDYAWWHGFYELKHRFNSIVEEIDKLKGKAREKTYKRFPGRYQEHSDSNPKQISR
ncbi:multiheme c-type cytochrome [Thermodesulfobacteriota bacterium]